MAAPQLTQTARHAAPGASRTLLAVLAACLTFGSWCAAQYLAAQVGHAARLGPPAFLLPAELHLYARAAASLMLGGVLLALLDTAHGRSLPTGWANGFVTAAGDVVALGPEGTRVSGRLLPHSRLVARDAQGRPVPHVLFGQRQLAAGELWLYAPCHGGAFDSRYFGPARV